ncbi:MAG TPA: chromosome segregation protein SMC [Candidatus Eremiobacteraceae bacterium]|nr:chromosome segregation protein SMC [Candidatus Eremiobacteraceae bacterium]
MDLFGFKTFAERTHLDFHPGVSAIVGPNGSGKSNFVDAVRWVLGEQSARQLRGARMDDVIFAGNSQRRPLGMAEVTLTFDNADGALPTPFAELAITRRAYRSGESEFFLNKSQVRLRDITDLLLGTGLAAELAAIVSQGEIDAILSAKPEARRELFEGVAGTARYRSRKREAQRRLEQTAVNALRLNDLLIELEKQIPAIEQQVRRAKRYQKVNQQLRDFEILSYVRKTVARRDERARIVESLGTDENEAAAAARHHSELQAAVNKARADEYQASLALDERNATHTKLAEDLQAHASEHAAAVARSAELHRSCEALERDVDASAHAATQADARLSTAVEDLRRSRESRDEALNQAESAAALEAAGTADWERAYAALRTVEDARMRAVAQSTESNSAAAAKAAEFERLMDSAKLLAAEIDATQAALERSRAREMEIAADVATLDAQLVQLTAAQAKAEEAASAAASRLEELRQARESAHAQRTQLSAKRDALAQFETGAAGAPSGTRELLDAAKAGKLAGVMGTVASQIRVDDRYATAIDAALGVRAHDVIVRSLANAKAAMQLLKSKQAGRATLIALESLAPARAPAKPAGAKQIIGRAADLVRCDATVKAAVEQALGQTFVAATLDDAFDCAERVPEAAFVTLEGDVIRGGIISSGAGIGPVSAHAALAALELDMKTSEQGALAADVAVNDALKALAAAHNHLEQRKHELMTLALRQHDAQSAREHHVHERAALEQRLVSVRTRSDELASQSALVRSAVQAGREAAAKLAGEVEALEARRGEALATSDALAHDLNDVRAGHRSAAAHAAALVERVAQLSDDVESARAELERAVAQRKERLSSLARMREERAQSAADVERLAGFRKAAEKALAAVAVEVQQLREQRDARAKHARELDAAYAQEEHHSREQSLELERLHIRLAEIDAELALLQQTFSQNPATPHECNDVEARYQDFDGDSDAQVRRLREELLRLGNVNLNALEDRAATLERCEFLRQQLRDLEEARSGILASIAEIDAESLRKFNAAFEKVAVAFSETFTRLFNGGSAKIWVSEAEDPTEAGIEISAQPPGKKMQNLNLLSGGERALTAVALIFATLQVRPSPFYIFDEIDAALDEANVGRFGVQLAELAGNGRSQIIIITHNKATMTLVDRMYGVTMSEPGVSNVLSLSLEHAGAGR